MLQLASPVHAPDHPENWFGGVADAVSTTVVLGGKFAEQPVPEPLVQLIPAGVLVTVPVPVPDTDTASEYAAVKVAVTFSAAVTVKLQEFAPEHAPLHPPK